ncbi:rhomboid family intramembrane serine protease [Clostridioides difficile]
MNKIQEKLFSELVNKSGFYIKDYLSEYSKCNKWIAILENKDFIYAVVTCNENESEFIFEEARQFLLTNYSKNISLNIVIYSDYNYEELKNKNFNKLIYSIKEEQVVYSDESCKPLVTIINNCNKKKTSKRENVKNNLITYILITVNILIYIITCIISKNIFDIDSYTLVELGAKVNYLINNGQPWRLITSAFLHGGLAHIAFNMYSLKIIGEEVEYVYGKVKYIAIYLISALGGSIFSYLFNADSISVGASGAIFGLLGAMIVFGISHKDKIGKAYIINLFKVVLINIFIGVTISNIDNSAHIGGLLFGIISAFLLRNKKISII